MAGHTRAVRPVCAPAAAPSSGGVGHWCGSAFIPVQRMMAGLSAGRHVAGIFLLCKAGLWWASLLASVEQDSGPVPCHCLLPATSLTLSCANREEHECLKTPDGDMSVPSAAKHGYKNDVFKCAAELRSPKLILHWLSNCVDVEKTAQAAGIVQFRPKSTPEPRAVQGRGRNVSKNGPQSKGRGRNRPDFRQNRPLGRGPCRAVAEIGPISA